VTIKRLAGGNPVEQTVSLIRFGGQGACELPRIVEVLRPAIGTSKLKVMRVTAPWRQEPAGWARVTFGHLASFWVGVFF
jgi:hypothetical protein